MKSPTVRYPVPPKNYHDPFVRVTSLPASTEGAALEYGRFVSPLIQAKLSRELSGNPRRNARFAPVFLRAARVDGTFDAEGT
jgi:hypothetical protein